MFDFQKLIVYKKTLNAYTKIDKVLCKKNIDQYVRYQLKRSSMSMVINIAEGTGKSTNADRKNLYTIARDSVYESASLLEIIKIDSKISEYTYNEINMDLIVISKMLSGLIISCRVLN